MTRLPDRDDEINTSMYRIDGEGDDLAVDDPETLEESAYEELEEFQTATFEEAIDAIQEDSLEPQVLTGFSDITRKQVHELRKVWLAIEEEDARRTIADHVSALALDDIRLDFMRFFRVLLEDPAASVRQVAAAGLEPYDDPALIQPLIEAATGDPDEDVRHAAVETLGSFAMLAEFEMLEPKIHQALRKTLVGIATDPANAPRLRAAALVSVSVDTATPNLVETIQEHYDSGEPDLRIGALRAMGRAGGDWVGLLERAIRSNDADEREAAATSLGQFEGENVVPMLTMLAREDVEMPVRVAAIEALAAHGGRAAQQSLQTLREYVSDDELDVVDAAIAEVEEFIAIEEGADDEAFIFDPGLDDEDDY